MPIYFHGEDTQAEIRAEELQLRKANADVSAGQARVRNQECLLADIAEQSTAARQGERLVALLKGSLIEWERHRVLIEQRLTYLRERHRRELES